MKIYTKTGDKGKTSLFGGKRVSKTDLRVQSYGTIDELNSFVGLLITSVDDKNSLEILNKVQHTLFVIGGQLATETTATFKLPEINESDITILEQSIDAMEASLKPLTHFILPTGSVAIANANICRTVCRRAERLVVGIKEKNLQHDLSIKYLNRLSDYFFVLGRYLAHLGGVEEVIWVGRG
jgi:cob(I)alamin adenosyltransferase